MADFKLRLEYQLRDASLCGVPKLSSEEEVMVFIQGLMPRSRARKHMDQMLENSNQMLETFPRTIQEVWNEVYTMENVSSSVDVNDSADNNNNRR